MCSISGILEGVKPNTRDKKAITERGHTYSHLPFALPLLVLHLHVMLSIRTGR